MLLFEFWTLKSCELSDYFMNIELWKVLVIAAFYRYLIYLISVIIEKIFDK